MELWHVYLIGHHIESSYACYVDYIPDRGYTDAAQRLETPLDAYEVKLAIL